MNGPGPDGRIHVSGTVHGDMLEGICFSELEIDGDTVFEKCVITDADISSVEHRVSFIDCEINGLIVRTEQLHPGVSIDKCFVRGLVVNAKFTDDFSITESRLQGMSDLSGSVFELINIKGTNCEYVKATGIHADDVELDLSRFVQLFDLKDSRILKIDLRDTIILETFRLPKIENEETAFELTLNGVTINGKIILDLPGSYRFQKAFIDRNYDANDSSGMAAMKSVLESNRRFSAADYAFIQQKKKERDKNEKDYETSGVQRTISEISYVLSGNGMRPVWILLWMIGVIGLFAVLYRSLGIESGLEVGGTLMTDALYLSLVSFFVCDTFAVGSTGMWMMIVENVVGLLMMLYFTVILTRKLIR